MTRRQPCGTARACTPGFAVASADAVRRVAFWGLLAPASLSWLAVDEAKLFSASSWKDYRQRSFELSSEYKYVVVTDIADFYPRVYHHRLENALNRLPSAGDIPKRIMTLLGSFSKNVSYGLPVGGPASRILSELCLDSTDRVLLRSKVKFCRYVDDYSIFCKDKTEAYRVLVLLSESLFNEGLVLQKNKTNILTSDEFRSSAKLLDPKDTNDPLASDEQKLLNITLRYDPYSETAEDDYEALKAAMIDIDIIGILGREVVKTSIDSTVTKQAIKAIQALKQHEQYEAIRTLLNENNLEVLSPVFVTVMRAVRGVYENLSDIGKKFVDSKLIGIYESDSHLLSVDLNMSFYLQALAQNQSARKEEILLEVYERKTNPLIKRLIIIAMSNWNCHYWLTDLKRKYAGLSEWEKRYFIGSSYVLGDEGKYWRSHMRDTWSPMDELTRCWFSERMQRERWLPL
ncbi:RNA-directed DNA polymerase [Acidithiobacillus sp. IBUN Pt1247-S3]|uniref:RNA-directed DNA polymerase n=1 Tax=Acidithiobacillus sp. IBUN Pt1247-S3 TaxID=3166642 RepID=UPI0034E61525